MCAAFVQTLTPTSSEARKTQQFSHAESAQSISPVFEILAVRSIQLPLPLQLPVPAAQIIFRESACK
jgi:hypothetical protein